MEYTVDLDGLDGITRQRGEEYTAHAVAEGSTKASLKGLQGKLAIGAVIILGEYFNIGLLNTDHSKPSLKLDMSGFTWHYFE